MVWAQKQSEMRKVVYYGKYRYFGLNLGEDPSASQSKYIKSIYWKSIANSQDECCLFLPYVWKVYETYYSVPSDIPSGLKPSIFTTLKSIIFYFTFMFQNKFHKLEFQSVKNCFNSSQAHQSSKNKLDFGRLYNLTQLLNVCISKLIYFLKNSLM